MVRIITRFLVLNIVSPFTCRAQSSNAAEIAAAFKASPRTLVGPAVSTGLDAARKFKAESKALACANHSRSFCGRWPALVLYLENASLDMTHATHPTKVSRSVSLQLVSDLFHLPQAVWEESPTRST